MKKITILLVFSLFFSIQYIYAQPANDNCSGAISLGTLPSPNPCSGASPGVGAVSTFNLTTAGATAENPYIYQTGCQPSGSMSVPALDVWYTFTATAYNVTVNFSSASISTPSIGIWSGTCGGLQGMGCTTGTGGAINSTFAGFVPGTTYYLQISGGNTTENGPFTLKLNNDNDCSNCLLGSDLTVTPMPVNGAYPPNTTVTFCYTISAWSQQNTNWLHGITLSFGAGWNTASIVATPPGSCSGSGTWGWYPNQTSSFTGTVWGMGFYYETSAGASCACTNGDPGDNFGDNCQGNPMGTPWVFCWKIKTNAVCTPGASLDVGINPSGDGESGSWSSLACVGDPNPGFNAIMTCCTPPTLAAGTILCNGGTTTATATPGLGTAPFTYSWSPSGGTAATTTPIGSGTYTCLITEHTGSSCSATITIAQPSAIVATTSQVNDLCSTGSTGSATVTPSGGTGAYTYSWSPSGGTGATASSLASGTYTCTIKDANGCSITKTFTITAPAALVPTPAAVNGTCGNANGQTSVAVTGGTGAYTYSWAPTGGTAATATGLAANTYTITVHDANGCSASATIAVTNAAGPTATIVHTNINCNGAANGSATVTPSGGTGAYTYSWSPSGGTGATASGLGPATYTCTIKDANGCSTTTSATITQPAVISLSASTTPATCGNPNGSATATASGGTGALTYSWTPSGGTAPTASALLAGTYTITITDANGCTKNTTATVTNTGGPTSTITSVNVSCNGGTNGSATITVTGGSPAYTYSWSPSGGTAATASTLDAGTYTCHVNDASGCTTSATAIITQPTALTATNTQTNILCNGASTGSASVTASGGTGAYTYSWTPSGGAGATASALGAGTYTCTIKDANGCSITSVVTLTQPPVLSATNTHTNVGCNGGNNGTASVTVTGGTTAYTYSWAPSGGATAAASGLGAGSFICTITDANGCSITSGVTITQPPAISLITSSVNASCGSSDGQTSVTASGGTGAYTYSWSPGGETTSTATGLAAGSYTVTVTDANNCIQTGTVSVSNATGPTAVISSFTNASCNGASNGSATVTASGGTTAYTYSWSPAGGTGATATGLSIGSYTVQVTDANGCITSAVATISQPTPATATNTHVDATCNGLADGFASVTASGGTGAYTYSWSPSGGTAATASGLSAGLYTCIITDANGCQITSVVTISQPAPLTATSTQVNELCNGGSSGSAIVTPSGGTGAYTYSWSPTGGTASTASGLSAGNYTCTIKDANGCALPYTITITQPTALIATTSSIPSSCGSANGSVTATPTGGAGSYTFSWSPGGATTSSVSNLLAGTYTCLITDANGCSITVTATFTNQNSPKVISTAVTNVTCFGLCNGTIAVNASGGTRTLTYSWSPSGGTTATASSLCPGTYTCTVTDANGCTVTSVKTITQPTVLVSAISSSVNITCNGVHDGSASATASGGTGTLTYSWSPSGGVAATASGLAAGLYTLFVTDSNGCQVKDTVTLSQPTALVVSTAGIKATCFGTCTGTLITIPTGGTSPYTFSWTTGCTSASCNNVCAGLYTVTVTDKHGCSGSDTASVTQPSAIALSMFTKPANCNHADGMDSVFATGGTPGYTYSWSPGAGSATPGYHNISPGDYVVTVHDANNCVSKDSITVQNTPGVVASILSTTNPTCFGGSNGKALAGGTGGLLPYSYSWSPAGGVLDTGKNLSAGNYTVTVTDAHGCTSQAVATIGQPTQVTATPMSPATICIGQCIPLTATGSGGTPGYTYSWTHNGTPAVSPACPTTTSIYTVVCVDVNGCSSPPATVMITVNPPLAVYATGDSSRCPGGSVHLNALATGGNGTYAYSWTPPTGLNNSSIPNPIATPAATTIYTVTVTDNCGTPAATATDTVKIYPQPVVLFDAMDTSGCVPLCVTFTELSVPACSSAVWTFGDGSTGTGCNNVPHCYTTPGTYGVSVTVKDINGCQGSLSRPNYIDVHPLPVAAFSESPQPTTIVNPVIHFTDQSTGAVSWAWNFGDLSGGHSTLQNPTYTYPDTGCYQALLTVANLFGCIDSVSHPVCIHPDFAFWVPDAFTPNADGKNDGWTPKGVGVDPDHYHLMIFDRWGSLIWETRIWGQAWDGHANGGDNIAQIDAYVWQISVSDYLGNGHSLRGVLFLVK